MNSMKINKLNIRIFFILMIAGLITMDACKKEEIYPRTRLFQPVLNEDLFSVENTIIVNLGKMKEARQYTIEVSRDTFLTIDYTVKTDTNYLVINKEAVGEDLLWFTLYQVRATALADDAGYNSLPSPLGAVRTQKFPSNMGTPTYFDVLDTRARVFWTPSGQPITSIKVFDAADVRLIQPILEFDVTDDDRVAAMKIIGGLEASSSYQIAIYSGETIRGWELYATRQPLVSGDNVVDLTGIDTVVNLANILPDVSNGSVILLEGGKTYLAGGYAFDKSVSFISGYSFTPALPIIDCNLNFNLSDGSTVDYVTFKDINLTATDNGFGSRYVFNIDKTGFMGEIKYESCVIHAFRGLSRVKDGSGTLDKYTILDCKIDSIKDYGILTMDKNTWICNEITIKNSTISKAIMFLTSRNNSNSITIDGCTFNEMPEKGRQMFRWREAGNDNVLNGITISNTIWGHGWNTTGDADYRVDGYDGMGTTNWIVLNTYTTSDFGYVVGKEEIPGFPSFLYAGPALQLWTDPYNSIFNFKDTGFAGKSDSGDPRWRIGP